MRADRTGGGTRIVAQPLSSSTLNSRLSTHNHRLTPKRIALYTNFYTLGRSCASMCRDWPTLNVFGYFLLSRSLVFSFRKWPSACQRAPLSCWAERARKVADGLGRSFRESRQISESEWAERRSWCRSRSRSRCRHTEVEEEDKEKLKDKIALKNSFFLHWQNFRQVRRLKRVILRFNLQLSFFYRAGNQSHPIMSPSTLNSQVNLGNRRMKQQKWLIFYPFLNKNSIIRFKQQHANSCYISWTLLRKCGINLRDK